MKKVTIAVASLFAAASFAAVAAPVEMSKKEMSKVVAGAAPADAGLGTTRASFVSGETILSSGTPVADGRTSPPAVGGGKANNPTFAP